MRFQQAASRNDHNVGYVKQHSRQILSVAISMPRSIRRQSLVIKAIQVRSLIVLDHVDQKEKRGKTQVLNDHRSSINRSTALIIAWPVIVLTDVKIKYKSVTRQ